MAEPKASTVRSLAAQEASRRNGAKSRGPRSPAGKAKSVVFTEEGLRRSEALFREMFTRAPQNG